MTGLAKQFVLALGVVLSSCLVAAANAENAGQKALDEATAAKISAESMEDLGGVIRLCHQALEAGLDKAGTDFAKKLLAGTLLQRAEIIYEGIFDRPTPPAEWPQYRQLALSDLEESLEADEQQPEAHLMVARLESLPGGDRERAAKAAEAAVHLTEKEPLLHAKALVQRANLSNDAEQKEADLDEAARLAPHNAEVMRTHGLFLLGKNKAEAALKDFDAAVAANPNQVETHEARGLALMLLKKYDEAMQSFDKVLEMAPSSPIAYVHRARVQALQEHYPESLIELQKALKIDPSSSSALLLRASVYQQMGESDKALADVDQVLRFDPGHLQAARLHAVLLAGNGKLDQAIDDLEGVRENDPDDTDLLLQLGIFYTADQKPQKAVETYSAVLQRDPKNWAAFRGRGDAYLSLSKQADAIADYEEVLKLDPENSGVLNNLAWVLATSTEAKLRDGKRAIELAMLACKVTDYKEAHILSTLAAGYAETGDFKTAITWSQKAVDLGVDRMKDQLRQELVSYQAGKPWREAAPPPVDTSAKPAAKGEKGDDTSNLKKPGSGKTSTVR